MAQEKKKIAAIAGSIAVTIALCIFGGPYAADRIRADHEAHLQKQMHMDALTMQQKQKTKSTVVPEVNPIEPEIMYDEDGNIIIDSDSPGTAEATMEMP